MLQMKCQGTMTRVNTITLSVVSISLLVAETPGLLLFVT